MQHWTMKSESDTEKVYAQVSGGKETGRYRYVFHDGRPVVEVGETGLLGRTRAARHPRTVRNAALASAVAASVLGDVLWHVLR